MDVTTTYGTSTAELMALPETMRVELDARPIVRLSTWLPVTRDAIEEAETVGPWMEAWLQESMRRALLGDLGFVGQVRCARCRRRLRCVWAEVDGRYYGRDCYRVTFGTETVPA